jgi:hypothetical protein
LRKLISSVRSEIETLSQCFFISESLGALAKLLYSLSLAGNLFSGSPSVQCR